MQSELRLVATDEGLELHHSDGERLRVEYSAAELKRYRPGASGKDLLRRAVGNRVVHVVDATAGLGRDAVHLACLGYRVTAIERNSMVSAIAQDGLQRACASQLLEQNAPNWREGDARLILPTLGPPPDAVYLDPMFPAKKKPSAAVRKEMRLLRALVADDTDASELFDIAMTCATQRVIVKRADDAPPLAPKPDASYAGKTVRYDVYFRRGR